MSVSAGFALGPRSGMIVSMVRVQPLLLAALLLSGCGDDLALFEGSTGTPREIDLLAGVPAAEGRVQSGALQIEGPLLLDTGAPVSLVDREQLGAESAGWRRTEIDALGLRFRDVEAAVFELFGSSPCAVARPVGVVGGDLLRHFVFDLDYRAQRVTLHEEAPALDIVDSEAPFELPLQLLGGGRAQIAGLDGARSLPATRLLMEVTIEGATRWAMIDTGASLSVVRREVVEIDAQTRPQACCFSVTTVNGQERLPLARLRDLSLGGKTTLSDVSVLVGSATLFELLSAEVGREVDLLLGANVLARFGLRIDSKGLELQLARYSSSDHLVAEPWLLPGFSFCRTKEGQALVQDVFGGSDAEAKGLKGGERVIAVDGRSLAELDDAATRAALVGEGVGDTLSLQIAGKSQELIVEVERVLPLFVP